MGPAATTTSLYQSLRSVTILPPPFDYLTRPSFSPRTRRSLLHKPPRHTRTAGRPPIHPLLGLAYVRPVRQPVLLTDVRIDNLCPLIMTVRSRARRYLTVRVIAISSSMVCPASSRRPPPQITTRARRYRAPNFGLPVEIPTRRQRRREDHSSSAIRAKELSLETRHDNVLQEIEREVNERRLESPFSGGCKYLRNSILSSMRLRHSYLRRTRTNALVFPRV